MAGVITSPAKTGLRSRRYRNTYVPRTKPRGYWTRPSVIFVLQQVLWGEWTRQAAMHLLNCTYAELRQRLAEARRARRITVRPPKRRNVDPHPNGANPALQVYQKALLGSAGIRLLPGPPERDLDDPGASDGQSEGDGQDGTDTKPTG